MNAAETPAFSPTDLLSSVSKFLVRHGVLCIFFLSLAACGLHALRNGMPYPGIHDEFAYLLGAETLADGRLSNPPHPLKHFFQTYHVLDTPTYAPKYPLGPSAVLALGMLLGHPILGVWLIVSAFCASIVWVTRKFMSPGWSVIVGMAAIALYSGGDYWAQSYWGGALAGLGGALLFGGVIGWMRKPAIAPAIAGAIGIVLLVHSRPFEGALFGAVLAVVLLARAWRLRASSSVLPGLAIFALGVAAALGIQAAINQAVTGEITKLPYQAYQETRDNNPVFFWNARQPAMEFEHDRLELFDYKEVSRLTRYRLPVYKDWLNRLIVIFALYGSFATIPVLAVAIFLGGLRKPLLMVLFGASVVSACVVHFTMGHYQAPFAAAMTVLFALCYRRTLAIWRKLGGASIPKAMIALPVLILVGFSQGSLDETDSVQSGRESRRSLDRHLQKLPGEHMVVVRYSPGVNPNVEYVFNGANIDEQKVVWARWSENQPNGPLFEYFRSRRFWLLEVGVNQSTVREFSWNLGESKPANLSAPLDLREKVN